MTIWWRRVSDCSESLRASERAIAGGSMRIAIAGRPIPTRGEALGVTVSVGLALSTDFPKCGADEIIQAADEALYAAKAGGRNCVRMACPAAQPNHRDATQKEVTAVSK